MVSRAVAILNFLLLAFAASAAAQNRPPNILFAIADDWGWPHAGAYGDPVVETPTFDRIAREGILFHHAYVSSPSCTPSRAAILTGQYHWRLEESANLWSTLQAKFPVYPDLLEDAGYFVGYTRKGWGPGRIEPGGRSRNPAGEEYQDFATFLAERPADRPFSFWFGSSDPHRDYEEGSGAASGMDLDAITLAEHFPDSPEVRGDVADYYWEVQRFDREVGELLEMLERAGELDNTVVIMTGDHGMPFPRCKGNLYDCGARVPLTIRWPGVVRGGRSVEGFVSLTDLAPTFLGIAGIDPPAAMTGASLIEILRGSGTENPRDYVLIGKERHVPCQEAPESGGTPMRAIRTRDYLYIRNFEPDRWPAGTPDYENAFLEGSWYGDVDNGPTKTYIIENRDLDTGHRKLFEIAFGRRPAEELYDLRNDPGQLDNVAAEPAYMDARNKLSAALDEALAASGDPRVAGEGHFFDGYPYYGGTPLAPGYEQR
jgi:N-sulfoglucosamine sulfohydrolase